MAEATFVVWCAALGLALCGACARPRQLLGRMTFAVPVGLALFVTVGWALSVAGGAYSSLRAVLACTFLVGLLAGLRHRRWPWARPPNAELGSILAFLGLVGIVSLAVQHLNPTQLTPDSLRYIQLGSLLNQTGGWGRVPADLQMARQAFVPLVHSVGGDAYFLASIDPLLGLSGLAMLVWSACQGLRMLKAPTYWSVILITAVLAVLLSTGRVFYHFVYLNSHCAMAVYTLLLVFTGWMSACRRDLAWVLVSLPALSALMLARPESPLHAALIVLPIVASTAVPAAGRLLVAGVLTVMAWLWFGLILREALEITTVSPAEPVNAAVYIGAGITVCALGSMWPRLRPVVSLLPAALVVVLCVALAGVSALEPEHARQSFEATLQNLTGEGQWGLVWLPLGALALAVGLLGTMPHRAHLVGPVLGFFPMALLLGVVRQQPYRVGPGDSLNRMLMHILLTLGLLLVLGAAGRLRHGPRTHPESEASSGPSPAGPACAADARSAGQ